MVCTPNEPRGNNKYNIHDTHRIYNTLLSKFDLVLIIWHILNSTLPTLVEFDLLTGLLITLMECRPMLWNKTEEKKEKNMYFS